MVYGMAAAIFKGTVYALLGERFVSGSQCYRVGLLREIADQKMNVPRYESQFEGERLKRFVVVSVSQPRSERERCCLPVPTVR